MTNLHLFELINAAPGLSGWPLWMAQALADDLIYLVSLAMAWAWLRGDHGARVELLQMLVAATMALMVAQVVAHVWPQPRPFAMHVGHQYLAHSGDPGMPSDHVTFFWSLALAALSTRRFDIYALPMLSLGLLVGWSRVFLGVHFPFDIVAALPVAAAGALIEHRLRRPFAPLLEWTVGLYDRLERAALARRRGKSWP
jgi:undecaprenyl-diphosphatase